MKKYLPLPSFFFLAFIFSLSGFGQSFTASYNFSGFTASSGKTDPTPVPIVEGLLFGSFQASAAVSANSTAGNRFSFTNFPVGATQGSDIFTGSINTEKYYEVILTPVENYLVDLDSLSFTLQRSGTGIRQYVVRSDVDNFASNLAAKIYPSSSNLKVIEDNVFQVTDGTSGYDGSKITLTSTSFKKITGPLTFRFYGYNAEGTGGSFSIDNVTFYGNSIISPTAPNIILSAETLNFPATDIHGEAAKLSYTVSGANLTDPVTISVPAPYGLSKSEAGVYNSSISFTATELLTGKPVYVQFKPLVTGTFIGEVVNASTGAVQRKISVSGDGINSLNLSFDFNDCLPLDLPGSGFLAYSVTGDQKWACTTFGTDQSHGVDINGYAAGAQENEDWLISPSLNFSTLALPILRFLSRGEFVGNTLQLLISTDYDGVGNPGNFTWTDLKAEFPMLDNTWKATDGIDLSAYKSSDAVHLAFKYVSSASAGASRWTIDDISITNRTLLLTITPSQIDFNEISSGGHSAPAPVKIQAAGYGDITVNAPAGFEVSADGQSFTPALSVAESGALTGQTFYIRFSPVTRQLILEGRLAFTALDLDSLPLYVKGSSYPKSETFDVAAYNLSFFGSTPENNPTKEKINLQVQNIATVMNQINMDVIGFEEMSNDVALDSLLIHLPHHKAITSTRWSYSFEAPDPAFPPQKTGFIYDSLTMKLVSSRPMFVDLYDKARTTDPALLPSYPTGTPSSFWASGRLPFLATFDVDIQGKTKRINLIDIHGKSASDKGSFDRRKYDMQVLKDTLDTYFANENVIIVGDYNDRAYQSIYLGSAVSPFQAIVNDTRYDVLTLPLDMAGKVSFISGSGLIDHITITNDLVPFYIANSTQINDPRTYISNYNATTASDHLPVFARFDFSTALPVTLISFTAEAKGPHVEINWLAAEEHNNNYFEVERSLDALIFSPIAKVGSLGNNSGSNRYKMVDSLPGTGVYYYRLKQVDKEGKVQYSLTVAVNMGNLKSASLGLYPNPVKNFVSLNIPASDTYYIGNVISIEGKSVLKIKGDNYSVSTDLNNHLYKLKPGMYVLKLDNGVNSYSIRFVKE